MDILEEIDVFFSACQLTQDESNNLVFNGITGCFESKYLADWFVNQINFGWKLWRQAQAVPEWISVEDSLPKKNANVLLNVVARRRGKPFSCIGFYSVEPDDEPCFILDDNFTILKGVTHWMPLPDAPQEPANEL